MGMLAVNTGLEVQLEPSTPSPSWQVETPSQAVFVWETGLQSRPSYLSVI